MTLTKKKSHQATVECPHCVGIIEVYKETEVISPAVAAEKKVVWLTEKSIQTKLQMSQ